MLDNNKCIEHKNITNTKSSTALYIRLSREDGDISESLSITNQRLLLTDFINKQDDLVLYDYYIDDGFTGTNFERPDFIRMINDIESKKIQCVIVKDLSRLGRHSSKVSEYINEYFPSKKVRFIAITDDVDKEFYSIDTNEDMMIDFKNMFNGLYPKDISAKVRSTFRTKQHNGLFIGAFASYGYKKCIDDHNKLEIDIIAANIVKRIFNMYLCGMGQNTIAKALNEEGIPCPSEYKKQTGLHYRNSKRLNHTSYWTYSTIRKILTNEIYIGNLVQNKAFRQICKKKAISLPKEQWIIVENTHEPIIDKDTWNKVQMLLTKNTKSTNLNQNIHIFAGFIKCGDCGRAMVKLTRKGKTYFNCGSYNRYGNKHCTIHSIEESKLQEIVLNDLNIIIKSVKNLKQMIEDIQEEQKSHSSSYKSEIQRIEYEIELLASKRQRAYEDYLDGLISKDDYIKHKNKFDESIELLNNNLLSLNHTMEQGIDTTNPWIDKLLQLEQIEYLDRSIIVEMISMIYIYENNTIKIEYNFSDELETLLNLCNKTQTQ